MLAKSRKVLKIQTRAPRVVTCGEGTESREPVNRGESFWSLLGSKLLNSLDLTSTPAASVSRGRILYWHLVHEDQVLFRTPVI